MANCGYRERCLTPARCDEAQTCTTPYTTPEEYRAQIASLSAENERLRAAISEFKRITDAQGWCAEHMTEAVKNLFAALLSPTAGREVVCVPREPTPEMATAAIAVYEEHEACWRPPGAARQVPIRQMYAAMLRALLGPRTEGEGK